MFYVGAGQLNCLFCVRKEEQTQLLEGLVDQLALHLDELGRWLVPCVPDPNFLLLDHHVFCELTNLMDCQETFVMVLVDPLLKLQVAFVKLLGLELVGVEALLDLQSELTNLS
jgi:hypothetical protein